MPVRTAVILAPAAELLVKVEGCRAIACLDVGEPFSYDIQESSIKTDGSAY
jgi:hypothetical protein